MKAESELKAVKSMSLYYCSTRRKDRSSGRLLVQLSLNRSLMRLLA